MNNIYTNILKTQTKLAPKEIENLVRLITIEEMKWGLLPPPQCPQIWTSFKSKF